jgi:hypothetical protein
MSALVPDQNQGAEIEALPKSLASWNPAKEKYTPELFEGICQRVEAGEPLKAVLRDVGINIGSFWDWCHERHGADEKRQICARRYERAKELGADSLFEQYLEGSLALFDRDNWAAWAESRGIDPKSLNAFVRACDAGLGRTMDALKRLNPAKYGDKQQLDHNINPTVTVVQQLRAARERERLRAEAERQLIEYNSADCNTIDVARAGPLEREGDERD